MRVREGTGSNQTRIYLDGGNPDVSGKISKTNMGSNVYSLKIVDTSIWSNGSFNGLLDEIAIWKATALTQQQVEDLYNSGEGKKIF